MNYDPGFKWIVVSFLVVSGFCIQAVHNVGQVFELCRDSDNVAFVVYVNIMWAQKHAML